MKKKANKYHNNSRTESVLMKVKRIISIIVVLVWMGIVFSFSGQKGEGSSNTSKAVSKTIVNIIDIRE